MLYRSSIYLSMLIKLTYLCMNRVTNNINIEYCFRCYTVYLFKKKIYEKKKNTKTTTKITNNKLHTTINWKYIISKTWKTSDNNTTYTVTHMYNIYKHKHIYIFWKAKPKIDILWCYTYCHQPPHLLQFHNTRKYLQFITIQWSDSDSVYRKHHT